MAPIATLRNLEFSWPGSPKPVLTNLNLTVEEGARYLLHGPNGAGKSSLLGLLAGIHWPCAGEIFWHGKNGPEHSRIFGRSISALVSPAIQENIQRQNLSSTFEDALPGAFDDSPFAFAALETDREKLRLTRVIARELQCEHLLKMPLSVLSQGELRIMLCARALLKKPRLCLLDEAFDGLDEKRRAAFFGALSRIAPACAIILATHRENALPDFQAERLYLENGRLRKEKTAKSCASKQCRQMRKLEDAGNNQLLLDLRNVSVFVNRVHVLRDIDWQTRTGEHWRISGENGSGKSTLLRLLAGEEQAHCAGRIKRHLGQTGPLALAEIQAAIRLVSDAGQALYGYDLSGLELVLSGFEQSIGLYREYSPAEKRLAEQTMRKFFDADEAARIGATSIRKLSSGQLRRLHLARALMGAPQILLLDEATSGLDAKTRETWFDELAKLSRNVQIIMVSHHDEDAPAFINRKARMIKGRLEVVNF